MRKTYSDTNKHGKTFTKPSKTQNKTALKMCVLLCTAWITFGEWK